MPLQSKVPPIYRFMMSVAGFFPATVFCGCFIKKAGCLSIAPGKETLLETDPLNRGIEWFYKNTLNYISSLGHGMIYFFMYSILRSFYKIKKRNKTWTFNF